jgi:UDP-glucose 4-epimerase
MHVLVTGGAGFIGSHLVGELFKRGHKIQVIDNLSAGEASRQRAKYIEHTYRRNDKDATEVAELDVLYSKTFLRNIEKKFPHDDKGKPTEWFDAIVHLAAPISVAESIENPHKYREGINTATTHLLEAAREKNIKRVIIASTSAVYGNPEKLPISEDAKPNPLSPYAWEKFSTECLARMYAREYKMETVILRLFNVYGPRQDPSSPYTGVITNFMQSVKKGKPPVVFGDGKQIRDFVHVDDVIRAIMWAIEQKQVEPGLTLNIGSGKPYSINNVANACIKLSKHNLSISYQPPRAGDIRQSLADITKAKALGYAPQKTLETGLREVWTWYTGQKPG